VKVRADRHTLARIPWRASLAALASVLVALMGVFPSTAHAISRTAVLQRAHSWVAKKVRYSQHASFGGYRRDCSGFVSMAWKLGRSYTSSTIHVVAKHVPLSKLRPGDAIHTPGHVALFVNWANRAHTRYVAMEESQSGRPALRHVRSLGSHATGLRYRRIVDPPALAVAAKPLTGVSPTGTVPASATASATVPASTGATASPLAVGTLVSTLSELARLTGYATAAAPVASTGTAAALLAADAAPTHFFTSASQPTESLALVPVYG
jgi:hypothetical protein